MRALAGFWGVVVMVAACGVAILQFLGPPDARPPSPPPAPRAIAAPAPPPALVAGSPGAAGAPIAPPDPALLEDAKTLPGAMLPRVGADGRLPRIVYAAGYDPADTRPRIAVLLSGIGMSQLDSEDAINQTPAAISFAISPYSGRMDRLLEKARARGHEYLIAIPMEPQGFPLQDAGGKSLLTGATSQDNAARLDWALSRVSGYVGATAALNGLHGERFAAVAELMQPVLDDLAHRGLLYVDPRPPSPPLAPRPPPPLSPASLPIRAVDSVIDEPPVRTEIEAKLAALEMLARQHGSALGLADQAVPVTIARIATWANTLAQRGIALVPVSALLQPATAETR